MSDSHAHSSVHHHFFDAEQQKESATLGMWLILATEILLFGALFTAYAVYRSANPEAFMQASARMDWTMGGLNTLVLIISSVTMVFAVASAEKGSRKGTLWFLFFTAIFGATFLVVKYFEYKHHWHDHDVPGAYFRWAGDPSLAHGAQIFFFLYFFMTGLHALHMVIGLGLLAWMWLTAYWGKYSKEYYNPVEMVGLYWHFVDLVWIFLFPLLYLLGAHLTHGGGGGH